MSEAKITWKIEDGLVAYGDAERFMEQRVAAIRAGAATEMVWLLEHPPLYSGGTSARPQDLIDPDRFPVHHTGRGGQYTYHGPGQRVAYVMLDLKARGADIRAYVHDLESWLIAALARFNVTGEQRCGRVGIWIDRGARGGPTGLEDKIAAIGVRIRRWVTFHGIALNVEPDLEHFSGIVPCGIAGHGVTSLVDLGLPVVMADVDVALRETFEEVFGLETVIATAPHDNSAEPAHSRA